MTYRDIPGWFDFKDIYNYIYDNIPPGSIFVEIGAFLGKSTAYFAELLKENDKCIFCTIDTFEGSNEPGHEEAKEIYRDLYTQFTNNIKNCELEEYISVIKDDSVEASKEFANNEIWAVYIDGNHSYESVLADIKAWSKKVRPGGIIAGHDIDFPGVWKAVRETFKEFEVMGRSWLVRN